MVLSDEDDFTVVAAQGPSIKRPVRAARCKPLRTKLPPIPKKTSSQEQEAESSSSSPTNSSQLPQSTAAFRRKRRSSSASQTRARSLSPNERDELEEGSNRRYKRPSASLISSKIARKSDTKAASNKNNAQGKSKGTDKETKPKKVTKASLERAKLEEVRNDEYFGKLDDANIRRIARAHCERLYLIHRHREGTNPKEAFDVCGSKGNIYKVLVDRNVSCSCMDFKLRRQVCKHLLFVYIKVLRLPSHLAAFSNIRLSAEEVQQTFDEALPDPVAEAMAKPELCEAWKKAVGYQGEDPEISSASTSATNEELVLGSKRLIPEEGDVCGVCYEDLEPGSIEGLEFCLESCGRPIHTDCLETWFNTRGFARTCIWCRAKWHGPSQQTGRDKKKATGYSIGLGRRGAVVDSSGRQLNLAVAAGLADAAGSQLENILPDVADVDEAVDTSGWD